MREAAFSQSAKLRPATMADAQRLFQWRNHDDIRQYMNNSEKIEWQDHLAWLDRSINSADTLIFVMESSQLSVGYIKFDRLEHDPASVEWGFYKAPCSAPGTGSILCEKALELAFDALGVEKVIGTVLPHNERSIRLHEKLGFKRMNNSIHPGVVDEAHGNGVCFELTKADWQQSGGRQTGS